MEVTPILVGQRVILRPPRESDKRDRGKCVRNSEEYLMYGMDPGNRAAASIEESDAWYEKYSGQPFHWAISYEDRCIGTARLSRIEWATGTARLSIGIFESPLWNKGLGSEATSLALKGAFEVAKLTRIELTVLEFNARAIACYTKCGFSKAGIVENAVFLEGKWHREIVMSISEAAYHLISNEDANEDSGNGL
jgi:ribosomal-protein-alanine N-acetyltransferase